MGIGEKVTAYTVILRRSDPVGYRPVVQLSTDVGGSGILVFTDQPPAGDWLEFPGGNNAVVTLAAADFDRCHRLLQTESPVFFTATAVVGLLFFNLYTSIEPPGEGPADDDALAAFTAYAQRLRTAD
jgi:hypothetical protein